MAKTSADATYQPGIYRERGGKALVVKATATQTVFGGLAMGSGSTLNVKSGGTLAVVAGGAVTVAALATMTISGPLNVAAGGALNFATGSRFKRSFRTATQSLTLDASNSGQTILQETVTNIMTLPAAGTAGKGINYRFIIGTGSLATTGVTTLKVRPNAVDKFHGLVAGATDSEVLSMLGASDVLGDFVEIESDGSAGWYVLASRGTWTLAAAT